MTYDKQMKEVGGYWMYKIINGEVVRRRPTAQEIIEAEKSGLKYRLKNKKWLKQ